MKYARLVVMTFILLVCQATWVPRIALFGVMPDLFVALLFWVAIRRGMAWGVWTGFALGLLLDVESPESLGMHAFALAVTGIVVGRLSRQVDRNNPIVLAVVLLLAALSAETLRVIWMALSGHGDGLGLWLRYGLPGAIYTAILVPPLSKGVSLLLGRKDWILSAS